MSDQLQLPNFIPNKDSKNLFPLTKYLHAPFNFSFKKNGEEWLEYIKEMKKKDISFIIHYKPPFDEFYKDLLFFSSKYPSINFLFENPAGYILEDFHFEKIIEINNINLCLDTCHLFSSGIHLKPFIKKYKERIKLIHLNNSNNKFGSGIDRHEDIFKEGKIFNNKNREKLLTYIFSLGIDIVLETPHQLDDIKRIKEEYKYNKIGLTTFLKFDNLNENITVVMMEEINSDAKQLNRFEKEALLRGVDIISSLPFVVIKSSDLDGIKGIGEGIKNRVDKILKEKRMPVCTADGRAFPLCGKVPSEAGLAQRSWVTTSFASLSSTFIKTYYEPLFKRLFKKSVIAGSYRRKKQRINDIDLLVFNDIDFVIDKLKKIMYVEVISQGDMKASVMLNIFPQSGKVSPTAKRLGKNSFQLDIVKTTSQSFPFALLYFTGSKYFNIMMRKTAKKMGYKLNEYGLFKISSSKRVLLKSEKEIFNFLGMEYLKPSEREI